MGVDDAQKDGSGSAGATGAQADADKGGGGDLQKALVEERTKRQAAQAKLDDLLAKQAAADEEAAKAQGQFEALYTSTKAERETLAKRVADYEAAEQARNDRLTKQADAVVAGWPEADRALDPKGLDPETRLAQVQALHQRLHGAAAQTQMAAGARTQGAQGEEPIPPECAAMAKRIGQDPKAFLPVWKKTAAGQKHYSSLTKTGA